MEKKWHQQGSRLFGGKGAAACDQWVSVILVGGPLVHGTGNSGGGLALLFWLPTAISSHKFSARFLWALLVLSPQLSGSSPFLSELTELPCFLQVGPHCSDGPLYPRCGRMMFFLALPGIVTGNRKETSHPGNCCHEADHSRIYNKLANPETTQNILGSEISVMQDTQRSNLMQSD